jgi:2-dehydropantoate 2-reductase
MSGQFIDPRIAIVGSGAVGCFYGSRLVHSGRDVHFLMRNDLEHVTRYGLRIESEEAGNLHLSRISAYGDTKDIGPCDLAIIALKSTDNEVLEELIPPLLKDHTALLTLQNGLGNESFLADRFGTERVIGGLCFVCLNRISQGVVKHVAEGRVSVGEFSGLPLPRTHDIGLMLKHAGIPCRVSDSLMSERWRKLVWNIPFNGLAIVSGKVDTAAILADRSLCERASSLMREVIEIARCCGHALPLSMVDEQISVTKGMGAYKPSSLLDYTKGKQVEVESIWGEALRIGLAAGAGVKLLQELYEEICSAVYRRDCKSG